ncbi:hypothetical protein [Clostridium paridis]|uniref:Uncharacterized protein n=1 Tax=Clostridium paridis TaxID=2803863 RepID=A0A937K6C9_9CLOT|nr:hypothetical protein [Clostridium paridis]MBL4933643.1 hypothetical protein [Clostridium paridis]
MKSDDEILNLILQKIEELNSGKNFYISYLVSPIDWNSCNQKLVGAKFRRLVLNKSIPVDFALELSQRRTPALYAKK